MPVRLTEKAIQAAVRSLESGKRIELADETLPGLRLRPTKGARASWVLACRDQYGRMRRFQVGSWPTDGIAAAREAARQMRVKVRAGADPIAESKQKRALGRDAKAGIGTLDALLHLYTVKVASKTKSWPETRRRIDLVFKGHLALPLAAISKRDLQMAADAYPAEHQAAGAVGGLRPVFKWASARGYADGALADLRSPATTTRRDRVLTQLELGCLLPVLRSSARPYATALHFMLLTLARREEVCGARWPDVDFAASTLRIIASRSKNGIEHTIPLSRQALALLASQSRQHDEGLIFCSRTGGHLTNWDRATKVVMLDSGTNGWTRHDLRRTGATMLGDMGETPDIIEAALNHVNIRSAIAATYNRSRYRPQVAVALQRLADALDGIASGRATVIPMRATGTS